MMSIATALRLAKDRMLLGSCTVAVMLQQLFQLVLCKLKTFRINIPKYEVEFHDDGIEVTRIEEVSSSDRDV